MAWCVGPLRHRRLIASTHRPVGYDARMSASTETLIEQIQATQQAIVVAETTGLDAATLKAAALQLPNT